MGCKKELVDLMHVYLDGDITKEQEDTLRLHLESCEECQNHFHELNRTITMIKSTETIQTPSTFTENVMKQLPAEKKWLKYGRVFKRHPLVTAVAIFFVLFLGGISNIWMQENKLVVSKQENLIIEGDTVIVPAGETVYGDLLVKNGKLIIDGIVDGDVTLINSELVANENDGLMAMVGEINGDFRTVDQMFEWIWYQTKEVVDHVFSFKTVQLIENIKQTHAP